MSTYNYKISVIIPAHNTAKYIKKCLDSLLYQTVSSIEVIIVDDASTENMDEVYAEYLHYPNVILIKNEKHTGPGGARNKGLEIANGEYIAFCDSDDWVELNAYEKITCAMDKHNCDIGIYSMERVYGTGRPSFSICNYENEHILNADMATRIFLQQYDVGIEIPHHCTNKVFRKAFLDCINAKFEENIYFQGKLFCLYTFLEAESIICVPNVKYKHFKRANSIIQSFDEKHLSDFGQSMIIAKDYLVKANLFEAYRLYYYKFCEVSLDTIIKEIFEFVPSESLRKKYLKKAIDIMNSLVSIQDYFEYADAETIRRHIQPYTENTILL